jgi:Flp pilus assembly protein TadG
MAVELVIVAPLVIFFVLLVVAVGRLAQARGEVEGAAADGARAASLARVPATATTQAQDTVRASLARAGVSCGHVDVAVDVAAFRPGGSVRVTVTCTASLTGLGLTGLPGSKEIQASGTAPIDLYRSA